MKCIFSIDVEDWFHILDVPSAPGISMWDALPSRVERNFLRLLDILSENNGKATCFFLGWVADRFPNLVREAVSRGHEIASHGYGHELVFRMKPQAFLEDAIRSKQVIENAGDQRVIGYRAPGFSVTRDTPWFFDKLAEAGYEYDSSVFPARRGHGGAPGAQRSTYIAARSMVEFPISVQPILGRPACFFGGGYLRLFPYRVIKNMAGRVSHEGRNVIFYIHPREIDPNHPRLSMDRTRRFQCYFNLSSTEKKLKCLLADFETSTFKDLLGVERRKSLAYSMHGEMVQ